MKQPSATQPPNPDPTDQPPEITARQVLEAVSEELNLIRRRLYECEKTCSRWEGAFNRLFEEELAERLGRGKAGTELGACSVSRLEQLKMRAEQNAQRIERRGR